MHPPLPEIGRGRYTSWHVDIAGAGLLISAQIVFARDCMPKHEFKTVQSGTLTVAVTTFVPHFGDGPSLIMDVIEKFGSVAIMAKAWRTRRGFRCGQNRKESSSAENSLYRFWIKERGGNAAFHLGGDACCFPPTAQSLLRIGARIAHLAALVKGAALSRKDNPSHQRHVLR